MKYLKMTREEFGRHVEHVARLFCWKQFTTDHPDATKEEADAHVRRNWRSWTDTVLDWMAMCEAAKEKDAAPLN